MRSTLNLPWNHISTHTFPKKKKKKRKLSSAPFTLPFIAPHQLNILLWTWLAPEPPESIHCLSSCASWCWVHCFCCHATPCHAMPCLFLPAVSPTVPLQPSLLIPPTNFSLYSSASLPHTPTSISPELPLILHMLPTRMEMLLRPLVYSHLHSAQLIWQQQGGTLRLK